MKKKILLLVLGIFVFSINSSFARSKKLKLNSIHRVKTHVKKLKMAELMHNLRMIVYKGKPNRFFATSGNKKVSELIFDTLQSFTDESSKVYRDTFSLDVEAGKAVFNNSFNQKIVPILKPDSVEYQKAKKYKDFRLKMIDQNKAKKAVNIIWHKKGKSSKDLLLFAHYDTFLKDFNGQEDLEKSMPGADNNASGVAILLSIIKLVHKLDLDIGLRVAFIDAQSMGFLGSYQLAKSLKKKNIIGAINLTQLAHDTKIYDKSKRLTNFRVYLRDKKEDPKGLDKELLKKLSAIGKRTSPKIKFEPLANNFKYSDNFRLSDKGFPTLIYTQNWEDDYNKKSLTRNDFPETLNQLSFYSAFQYLASTFISFTLGLKP